MAFETLPASARDVGHDAPERQRTVLIWLILAFIGMGLVMAPFSLWMSRSVYVSVPVALYIFTIIALTLNAAGAVALFRLRASAIRLFACAFAIGLVSGIYQTMTVDSSHLVIPPGADEAVQLQFFRGGQIGGLVFSGVLYAGILFYLMLLRRRAVLR